MLSPLSLGLIWLFAFGGGTASQLTDEQKAELGRYFGFAPFEIYKFEPGINQLKLADLNGDGKTDIALWNRRKSRVEFLLQPGPDGGGTTAAGLERNEIPNRGSLRIESLPIAYNVSSLEIGDVTGDGINDLVIYGESKELVILPGKKGGGFAPAEATRAPEGNPQSGGLCVGDFNGDKKTDVALLGPDLLQVYLQKPEGGLAKPLRMAHGIKNPLIMLTGDLDGDGRDDLTITADDNQYGVYAYLQSPTGEFGALRRLRVSKTRSITVAKPFPKPVTSTGDDILCVESETGRMLRYRWQLPTDVGVMADWPQRLYSYPIKSAGKRRPVTLGDINGDGFEDCVVLDPDAGQMFLFLASATGDGLTGAKSFPGLLKATDATISDVDGDGKMELVCVSADEKTAGVSKFIEGRLTYPTPLALQGAPLAVTVGSLGGKDAGPHFVYVTRENRTLALIVSPCKGGDVQRYELEGLDDDPDAVRLADANQDRLADILIFQRNGPLTTYLQVADGKFEKLAGADVREGLVKETSVQAFDVADINGDGKPEILLAQKNLARALTVKDKRWEVVDQYNPESADAELTGLTVLPGPWIAMYERKAREVLVFKQRPDKTFAVAQSIPVGNYDLNAMRLKWLADPTKAKPGAAAFGVMLADAEKLAILSPTTSPTLVETYAYEAKAKDAFLADANVGDFNADGIRDLVVLDHGKASLEILATLPDQSLAMALRFQVFQGRRFADAPENRGEPREMLVGDVNGDKHDDIVLIAHDRVIVYPGQ